VYGLPDPVVANQRPRLASGVLPLLFLVIGLAAATIWYVALPALDRQSPPQRSCEVILLKSGSTRCVRNPTRESQAAPPKGKPSHGAKH
jgi:hypothetical protein